MANQVIIDETRNQISVIEGQTRIIEVAAQGPQGPVGPRGETGPSGSSILNQITSGSVTASVDIGPTIFSIVSGSRTYLTVSSSGNIGINTTSPTSSLHIVGSDNTGSLLFYSEASGGIPSFRIYNTRSGISNPGISTANLNEAFGSGALMSSSIANNKLSRNVAIGASALRSGDNIRGSIAIGVTAMQFATGSISPITSSIAIGDGALGRQLGGVHNIAIGSNALLGVSATQANSGVRNIAIGAASLQSNTTGEFNTVIGDSSMVQNAVGSHNAIVGQNGLRNNTSGSYNTAIGSDVLRNSTTASFTTAVGALSLFDNLTGDRNIALGYNSGRGITSGRANTIIGSVTGLSAGLSNNIILADGDGNIKYRWDGTLNSISGSTIITGSLTVTGNITAQTLVVQTITSSVLYSSGSNIFGNSLTNTQQFTGSVTVTGSSVSFNGSSGFNWDGVNNRLGIGTASPSRPLSVVGLISTTSGILAPSINTEGSTLSIGGSSVQIITSATAPGGYVYAISNSGTGQNRTSGTYGSFFTSHTFAPTSGNSIYNGISIDNTINQTGGANGITRGVLINPTLTAASNFRAIEWTNNASGSAVWGLYGSGSAPNYLAGALGIGTNAPAYNLDITGNVRIGNSTNGFIFNSNTISTFGNIFLTIQSDRVFSITDSSASNVYFRVIRNTGNVLINSTTDTGERLQVSGSSRFTGNMLISGSANTSATNALTVQNSDAVNLFRVRNDNTVLFAGMDIAYNNVLAESKFTTSGRYFKFATDITSAGFGVVLFPNVNYTTTTGGANHLDIYVNFTPTSGNGTYNSILLRPAINQTGGANGVVRGLLVSPTITSASDFRAIEWTNNAATAPSASWGLYGSGNAPNFLSGSLLIGSTSNTGERLQVTGNVRVNGTLTTTSDLSVSGNYVRAGVFEATRFETSTNWGIALTNATNGGVTINNTNLASLAPTGNVNGLQLSYRFGGNTSTFTNNTILIANTINQTSGTGITRGLYVNPTLTAAADFRSIEWSTNAATAPSASWGLYGAGTAPNYLSGSLGIGTNTPSTALNVKANSAVVDVAYFQNNSTGLSISFNSSRIGFQRSPQGTFFSPSFGFTGGSGNTFDVQIGLGNGEASAKLHVRGNGSTTSTKTLLIQNSSLTDLLTVNDGGNVLINSTSDSGDRLQVSGSSRFGGNMFITGSTTVTGNVLISSGTAGTFIGSGGSIRYTSESGVNTNAVYLSGNTTGQDVLIGFVGGGATTNIYSYIQTSGYIGTRGSLKLGASSGTDVVTALTSSWLGIAAGTTTRSQINLAPSTAPTSPNNGDIWYDGTNLYFRSGSVTRTFVLA